LDVVYLKVTGTRVSSWYDELGDVSKFDYVVSEVRFHGWANSSNI